ncbi:MAG: zinc ribbon domain-containing protein, partial [Dehalococcoidia bacterium]|nr:zinc ribbon domain-containing protein [Dehalococcoidia bacterium]
MALPKLIPVPDELSKPFWDAINEKRLTVQKCTDCNTLQYPPRPACRDCGSDKLEWKETSGRGHILAYLVVEDGRLRRRIPDQPYNYA